MKFNLNKSQYAELFDQWNKIKQESSQRLKRVEQLSNSSSRHRQQQLQQQSKPHQPQRQLEKPTTESTNNTADNKDVVIRNLNMMKKVISGSL